MVNVYRFVASLVVLALCLCPLWLYLIVHSMVSPEGFWQKLLVVGVGVYFLLGIQLILGFFALIALYFVWTDG